MAGRRTVLSREARKEQLLESAASVFSEKGYRTASVSDIIEKAGVARGTFYHYFESKNAVFLELIEGYFGRFASILEANHGLLVAAIERRGDLAGAWREYALAILRFHSENPQLTAVVFREALGLDEQFSSKVEELSRLGRRRLSQEFSMMADRGLIIPCDTDLVSTMVNGALINIILEYVLWNEDADLEAIATELVRNQVRALSP